MAILVSNPAAEPYYLFSLLVIVTWRRPKMGFPHLADIQLLWPPLHCLHLCRKGKTLIKAFCYSEEDTPAIWVYCTYVSLLDSGWREDRCTYYVLSRESRAQSSGWVSGSSYSTSLLLYKEDHLRKCSYLLTLVLFTLWPDFSWHD